jgi:hypothetical protein
MELCISLIASAFICVPFSIVTIVRRLFGLCGLCVDPSLTVGGAPYFIECPGEKHISRRVAGPVFRVLPKGRVE